MTERSWNGHPLCSHLRWRCVSPSETPACPRTAVGREDKHISHLHFLIENLSTVFNRWSSWDPPMAYKFFLKATRTKSRRGWIMSGNRNHQFQSRIVSEAHCSGQMSWSHDLWMDPTAHVHAVIHDTHARFFHGRWMMLQTSITKSLHIEWLKNTTVADNYSFVFWLNRSARLTHGFLDSRDSRIFNQFETLFVWLY